MILQMFVLIGVMILCLFLRFPVFMSLGMAIASFFFIFPGVVPVEVIGQGLIQGINNYNFAALTFYFLLGEIMNSGGMSNRLIKFGSACIGHIRGSLSHINILASMVFGGVSGSAVADTAAIGSIMIPAMKKEGYDPAYAAAVTGASSTIGPIIPPSGGLVLMGIYMQVSINRLFLGGMVPGILMGVVMLIASFIISKKRNYPYTKWGGFKNAVKVGMNSFFAFMLPAIVVYCLVAGVGTVVEIGAIAVLFAILFSSIIYKELTFKSFWKSFCNASINTAKVLCILCCAGVYVWIISSIGVGSALAAFIGGISSNPTIVLTVCMLILFMFGMILDVNVIQMVIIPVMIPAVRMAGIDLIQFGVLAMLVTMMGLITPPVGPLIYITGGIAGANPVKVIKELIPFIFALVILVIFLILFPQLTTAFPDFVAAMQQG